MGYKWTVLVGKERMSRSWMATTLPSKGGEGRFATDKCLEHIAETGDSSSSIIVKERRSRESDVVVIGQHRRVAGIGHTCRAGAASGE